jgi:hypothetical protein
MANAAVFRPVSIRHFKGNNMGTLGAAVQPKVSVAAATVFIVTFTAR